MNKKQHISNGFFYEKDQNNIVTITIDMPDKKMNVINVAFGEALQQTVEKLAKETDLAGIILTSAKTTFIAGGDIDTIYEITKAENAFLFAENLKKSLRALEKLGKPVVAAINGTTLGGGLEVALACHYRIAIDSPTTKLGFPEVTLGLLPGAGGVVRTVWLLGLEKSLPLLTKGTRLSVQEAKSLGLIDELASDKTAMFEQAKKWILANPSFVAHWDNKKYKIPNGKATHPRIAQMLPVMPAIVAKETFNNYPAPSAILAVAIEAASINFDTACLIESRYFAELVVSKEAKNIMHTLWFQNNELKKGKSRPQNVAPQKTTKVGVLGAGMMGHGIAYISAKAGIEVVLKDVNKEGAEVGKAKIAGIIDRRIARGKMTQERKKNILNRIQTTGDAKDLKDCDLIIEAVFENRALKAKVTQEAEKHLDKTVTFASNTSTLPITGLAEQSQRPTQFVGLHFFSPVHRMQLVEIIKGKKTDDKTLAKAFDYVLQVGKVPIVVNDSRGFYTSRVFSTYTGEGMQLLAEGQHPQAIEMCGRLAGMPVGPLALLDEVSLKLVSDIRKQTLKDLGQEAKNDAMQKVLHIMVTKNERFGKAAGAGFYEYPKGENKFLWPKLNELFNVEKSKQLSQKTMIERLMFAQAIETVRCLEEGVLTSSADANIGSIFGWGFSPFKGGTLQYINDYGIRKFVRRAKQLSKRFGERFEPPAMLVEMAEAKKAFA